MTSNGHFDIGSSRQAGKQPGFSPSSTYSVALSCCSSQATANRPRTFAFSRSRHLGGPLSPLGCRSVSWRSATLPGHVEGHHLGDARLPFHFQPRCSRHLSPLKALTSGIRGYLRRKPPSSVDFQLELGHLMGSATFLLSQPRLEPYKTYLCGSYAFPARPWIVEMFPEQGGGILKNTSMVSPWFHHMHPCFKHQRSATSLVGQQRHLRLFGLGHHDSRRCLAPINHVLGNCFTPERGVVYARGPSMQGRKDPIGLSLGAAYVRNRLRHVYRV